MKISKEFKIGIVVLSAIAAFIWGVNFLKGSNIFSHKYYLYAVYPKIDNLIPANPVLINGYKIGQITDISLFQQGGKNKVLVKFLLTEDILIPKGSIAKAVSSDLLGSKAVEIIYSNQIEYVKSGDTLIAATEEGFKESLDKRIAPIQAKAENLINSMDSVMSVVNLILNTKTRDNLDKSFESVRKAILTLEQTAYKLDDLVGSEKVKISSVMSNLNQITTNLNKNGQKIDNIINNVSSMTDSLAKAQLKDAIANADQSMKQLNIMLAKINEGQGTLGKLAKNDSLYNNLNKSSEDLDKLLKDLRLNPERYIHFSVFGRKSSKPTKN
ncbi:MAG: MlaD family protein [Bacteroidota bacterium]|nr:MlaD family protein [Bacteroidota bacterium]MDP3144440.1 MlaD family protein [Bacteroidota bacterium]